MATEDPPSMIPRIVGVLNPDTAHYSVVVRVPVDLKLKFPDEPWRTGIDAIGLPKRESDKYAGYVLVDFIPASPTGGSSDMLWVFEKLDSPQWHARTHSRAGLIPSKFQSFVTETKTEYDVSPLETLTPLTGDVVLSRIEDKEGTGKARKTDVTEEIDAEADPLIGEEYGDIVTREVIEELVNDGESADTGILIISSVVEPLGNGKSVKQTKQVKGEGWPDPLNNDVSKDGSYLPPARYRKNLTRNTISRKIAASAIPITPTLETGEVVKSYKKETPDRAEEVIVSESFELDTTTVDEAVEQKPFVTITSTMTPGSTPVLPPTGNGSSKLVYEGPTTNIYENTAEVAVVKEGSAGIEKDEKPFVAIETAKKYSASPTIATETGSAQVIFNDGAVQVYEVSEVTSTGKYGPAGAEQQSKPFVKITSTATYQEDGLLAVGEVGATNKIYDDGTTIVYEKKVETAEAVIGPAGTEKDEKPFVAIETVKRYDSDPTIATETGSAQVIFNDGAVQVYEVSEVTSTGKYGPAGAEQQSKPFVKITSTATYQEDGTLAAGEIGSTNKIYDDGTTIVYEKKVETAVARPGLKAVETDAQQWGKIVSTTNYTTTDDAPAGGSVKLIFDDGAIRIYETTETEPSTSGTNVDIDAQSWGLIQWDGTYDTSPSGDKSRQVWSNGDVSVFLNENASLTISGTSTDIDPQNWGSITWNGVFASVSGGEKSRQVYSGPGGPVYLNEDPTATISGTNLDIDLFDWGHVKWNGTYASTPSGDRSRQVYSAAGISVFLNETAEIVINSGSFISSEEENPLLTETQTKSYGLTASFTGNGRSRVVSNIAGTQVYENISISRVPKPERTYPGVVNVDLPPIYNGTNSYLVPRRDGADYYIYSPIMTPGYRGPMPCEVTEYWSENPGSSVTPTIFRPSPMSFQSPLGGFSVGDCLHGNVNIEITVGTEHKIYEFSTFPYSYPATSPPTWVGLNIVAHVDSQAYLDGYIVREYRVQL